MSSVAPASASPLSANASPHRGQSIRRDGGTAGGTNDVLQYGQETRVGTGPSGGTLGSGPRRPGGGMTGRTRPRPSRQIRRRLTRRFAPRKPRHQPADAGPFAGVSPRHGVEPVLLAVVRAVEV